MREHIVEGVHILNVYTNITLLLTWRLQSSWHKGNCTESAFHHSLWQTAQCENYPVRGAQAVGASHCDFPLTWRRNTQIQMYWLRIWLESFMIVVGEELPSLPPLTARHWFFVIQNFEQHSCPEKQCCPETFHCAEMFFLSIRTSEQLVLALKNSVSWIHGIEYIFLIVQNVEQHTLALKIRFCPEIFHCVEIFFILQDFWGTCACPENKVCHKILDCISYTFYIQDVWATFACPETESVLWIHWIEYVFFNLENFEHLALALKTEFALKIFTVLNIVFH